MLKGLPGLGADTLKRLADKMIVSRFCYISLQQTDNHSLALPFAYLPFFFLLSETGLLKPNAAAINSNRMTLQNQNRLFLSNKQFSYVLLTRY